MEQTFASLPLVGDTDIQTGEYRASRAGAQLKAQIPWLRVFVEGVVIVGKLEN